MFHSLYHVIPSIIQNLYQNLKIFIQTFSLRRKEDLIQPCRCMTLELFIEYIIFSLRTWNHNMFKGCTLWRFYLLHCRICLQIFSLTVYGLWKLRVFSRSGAPCKRVLPGRYVTLPISITNVCVRAFSIWRKRVLVRNYRPMGFYMYGIQISECHCNLTPRAQFVHPVTSLES